MLPYMVKHFTDVSLSLEMRRFSWIILVGLIIITRILLRQRGRQEGQRWRGNDRSRDQGGDAVSVALKTEEGTTSQGTQAASRSWKRRKEPADGTGCANTSCGVMRHEK